MSLAEQHARLEAAMIKLTSATKEANKLAGRAGGLARGAAGGGGAGGALSQALAPGRTAAMGGGGGGGGGGALGAARGIAGVTGLAGGAALAAGGAALAAGGALAGGGLVNANRPGGSFSGGVGATATAALARIPVFGEISGAAGIERARKGAVGDLNSLTNQVARFAGADAISDKARGFLADTFVQQQKNIDADRDANKAAINNRGEKLAEGTNLEGMLSTLSRVADALESFVGSGGSAGATG